MSKIYPNALHGGRGHSLLLRHNRSVSDHLHRFVYGAVMGLAAWFVVAAWAFFYGTDYTGILLAIITGLVAIMIAIPSLLWLTWQKAGNHANDISRRETLRDWAAGEFKTNAGQIRGTEALTQVLLPIASVAIGLTIFGIAFHEVSSTLGTGA